MSAPLIRLRDEAASLIRANPDLSDFAPAPDGLTLSALRPNPIPSVERLMAEPGVAIPSTERFTNAVLEAAPLCHWRQTYTEAQVGADFLSRYGWTELWGPTGHFACGHARAYVAFWGEGLLYDWHWHEAEEIYFIAAGRARFQAEGAPDASLSAGQTRYHASNQRHAMTTGADPVLTLVLWRGPGLAGVPVMGGDLQGADGA